MLYNTLNQMKAKSLDSGKYADGQGLWLVKRSKTAGKWILRISTNWKRREMGLGPWPDVSIAEARERAASARRAVRDGIDPIAERKKQKQSARSLTVKEAIESCFKARQAELKGGGKAGRWMSALNNHVIPKIGSIPIEEIDQHHLVNTLEPIWQTMPGTASKALNRFNLALKHAIAMGLDVDLQAVLKAKVLLGAQPKDVKHIPSMPYKDAPAFYKSLKDKKGASPFALRFLMLTAARTTEVRLATFDEINNNIWTLAPKRTKSGREHRIPLTKEALTIVKLAREQTGGRYLIVSNTGKPLSDMAMAMFMRKNGLEARPHGFRATFRTWVEEQTTIEFEVKEAALGHMVDGGVVGAYQRSDRLEKRRIMMEKWSTFLLG